MKADELKTNLQLIQKRQKVEIKVTKKKIQLGMVDWNSAILMLNIKDY